MSESLAKESPLLQHGEHVNVLTWVAGGQTGADQGALTAAKDHGYPTGGWAPKGWMTEDGPAPWLAEKYGLKEYPEPGYPARTKANIFDADLTVLVGNMSSRGSKLAIATAKANNKPALQNPAPEALAQYIATHNPAVVNVGGNRASANPDAYGLAYSLVSKTIELLSK